MIYSMDLISSYLIRIHTLQEPPTLICCSR